MRQIGLGAVTETDEYLVATGGKCCSRIGVDQEREVKDVTVLQRAHPGFGGSAAGKILSPRTVPSRVVELLTEPGRDREIVVGRDDLGLVREIGGTCEPKNAHQSRRTHVVGRGRTREHQQGEKREPRKTSCCEPRTTPERLATV